MSAKRKTNNVLQQLDEKYEACMQDVNEEGTESTPLVRVLDDVKKLFEEGRADATKHRLYRDYLENIHMLNVGVKVLKPPKGSSPSSMMAPADIGALSPVVHALVQGTVMHTP